MKIAIALALGLVGIGGLSSLAVQTQDPPPTPLRLFMQRKLPETQKIFEGIVRGDLEMVAEAADKLHRLSKYEVWEVALTPEYRQMAAEMNRLTGSIATLARKGKVETASLGFIQLSTQCFQCHSLLRSAAEEEADKDPSDGVLPDKRENR